jgi:hypothetical protein
MSGSSFPFIFFDIDVKIRLRESGVKGDLAGGCAGLYWGRRLNWRTSGSVR